MISISRRLNIYSTLGLIHAEDQIKYLLSSLPSNLKDISIFLSKNIKV